MSMVALVLFKQQTKKGPFDITKFSEASFCRKSGVEPLVYPSTTRGGSMAPDFLNRFVLCVRYFDMSTAPLVLFK